MLNPDTLNQTMDNIFGVRQMWKGKYPLSYCELCETVCIKCPACNNVSCNGGGCDECMKDYPEWSETKHHYESYLTTEENKAVSKVRFLKRYIQASLAAGFSEINWQYLHETGKLCGSAYSLFDELKDFDPNYYRDKHETARSSNS